MLIFLVQSGMGDGDYVEAFHKIVLPIAYQYNPQLVLVSAGFDAAAGDPLGGNAVKKFLNIHLEDSFHFQFRVWYVFFNQ